jgi:hypothetical protein
VVGLEEKTMNEIEEQIERVRGCLEGQAFEMKVVILIALLVELMTVKYGKAGSDVFQNELRESYRKISGWRAN